MIADIQQNLIELELDILALEVELRLRMVKSVPLAPFTSPFIARSQLWLLGYLPSVLPQLTKMLKDMEDFPQKSDRWSVVERLPSPSHSLA